MPTSADSPPLMLITSISSFPLLLRPSMTILSFLAHSKSSLLNPDTSPILRLALKRTFYAQFCAGETPTEVQQTIAGLKQTGFKGVILGHAREVVLTKADAEGLNPDNDCGEQARCNAEDIKRWRENTINTIDLTQKGDFVALKFTGAGRQALQHLKANIPCAPKFEQAVHEMCQRAQARGVGLLFDAEQAALQNGIDAWTMYFAKIYNKGEKALVYGTYQAYAKRTPGVLAAHLQRAKEENFILGVKLVRGAYLGSDPRELFWPTIEGTHACYNGIATSLLQRQYGEMLRPAQAAEVEFPKVNVVLASHNAESVSIVRELRNKQAQAGQELVPLAYGQLMGMADNVSCDLVHAAKQTSTDTNNTNLDAPQAYKYLVWGKMSECMKYLLRRAQENKDAVSRTVEARKALSKEVLRRVGLVR
ncbi:putative proline dehydrogenase, mitochondrial [Cyphellophora attinorum]|uniref:Proline dehydrogenase n=1 Tax=Cyphellophora attinorum TaxID=1664694 RepID=A0A0N1H0S4_9EURO|nr:putative proline dehydrogenase, mitochondrial [Phialophora attinorum]KPI37635.1 putative proline dehydrogenase, mitochondrial [Phialophora attinorum]